MDIIHNFHGPRNGVVHCGCGQTYCPTDAGDISDHAAYHAEFARITALKGHVPLPHLVRERLKQVGRELLETAVTTADVFTAADLIVRAFYDRSFERAIQRDLGEQHPSLPEYARTIAEDGQLDQRANAALLATYPVSRASGMIDDTIWDPPPEQVVHSLMVDGVLN